MKKLSECTIKSNNLQFLRFIASVLVIVSHSFAISTGSDSGEWLLECTNSQLSLGGLAVSVFFCAGGFLIARSMDRVKDGVVYFKTRILRIFPVLAVVVVISAFVLGPCITQNSLRDYFRDFMVYKYLLNSFLILQHDLPGVFLNNPYATTINGSLWTLPVEFLCYIGCFIMWKLHFFEKKKAKYSILIVAAGVGMLTFFVKFTGMEILLAMIRPVLLFYVGILYYIYRDEINFTYIRVTICAVLLVLTNLLKAINVGMILFFPYLLLFFCFAIKQLPNKIGMLGNISYGIYLCAFPIQQVLVECFGGKMNPMYNMMCAIPLSIIMGYLLYAFVEEPATKYGKKYIIKKEK